MADTRKVLFTGFTPANFEARVNSLSWGLDNWMYGGGGLLGGLIRNPESDAAPIGLGSRDFRFNPDTLSRRRPATRKCARAMTMTTGSAGTATRSC